MIKLSKLKQHPKLFNNLFGITPIQFDTLLPQIEEVWVLSEQKRRKGQKHKIHTLGSGRFPTCDLEHRVAMLLMYLRCYPSHVFLGILFGIHDSGVCRYFRKLRPILESVLPNPLESIMLSEDEIMNSITLVDATEQSTEHRKKSGGSGFSGKRKMSTIKTQVITNTDGKILHISKSVPGNMHDKKLYDITDTKAKKGDLGYIGTDIEIPYKSSKYKPLTPEKKEYNKAHSRVRITIEHVFAKIKKFTILKVRFRGNLTHYNEYFRLVAGIHNLRFS